MLKKIAIVTASMFLGVCGGSAIGWLIGRTVWFFVAVLPNRNLSPEQFASVTFEQSIEVRGMTVLFFIPLWIILGAVAGLWIGIKQVNEESGVI